MRPLVFWLLAFALTAGSPQAQAPPAGAAPQISGRVVDARDGVPLRRARVTIASAGRPGDPVFTGDDGRFVVADAPRPPFTLTIAKGGYTSAVVTPTAAQLAGPLQFSLARSVAVMGRVVDVSGRPAPINAYVTARLLSNAAGGAPGAPTRFFTEADRLGAYRLGALAAGRYEISAMRIPLQQMLRGDALEERLFGSRDGLDVARVVTVSLDPGDELHNIDFTVPDNFRCPTGPTARPGSQQAVGRIEGRVTGPAGEPLVCAQVTVSPRVAEDARTDAQGRYSLGGLPAGSYVVQGWMEGHFSLQHGQRAPSDEERPVVLQPGERRTEIDITLPRDAVVSGTVVDEHGEPVEGLSVRPFELRRRNGRVVGASPAIARATDDRGQYRIIGVPPGSYLIGAVATGDVSTPDTTRGYVSTYHPGTTDLPLARPVVVAVGAELTGIDIVLNPVRTGTVSGVVLDPAGRPFAGTVSLTTSARAGVPALGSRTAQTDAAGRFSLRSVPPGDYVLKAPVQGGGSPLFGMQYVTVTDGDPAPITMQVTEGTSLEGRLKLDVAPGTNPAGLELTYAPADFDREPAVRRSSFEREFGPTVAWEGAFRMTGIFGPSRLTLARLPGCETCYLKSAVVNGVDAADTPFDFGLTGGSYRDVEVVVSDAGATIEGRVAGDADARAAFMMVVMPAADALRYASSRYVKTGLKRNDGRFEVSGLPPGEYIVAAANQRDGGNATFDPNDPDVAALLAARGTRVTVFERERASVTLRLLRR